MNAETLKQIVALLEITRPAWLPSQAWEDLVRQGAILTPEEASKITLAIKRAPEATIGKVVGQIVAVLKGVLA